MTEEKPERRARSRKRRPVAPMSKWKAWPLIAVMTCVTGFLLWLGLAIVVRSERLQEGRVDVTVQRRLLGFIPISTTTVRDVVNADVYIVSGRSGDRPRSRGTIALQLTARDGSVWRRTRFGPAFGTQPNDVAAGIELLIHDPDKQAFRTWWMPWVVNIGAVPFVFVVGGIWGSVLLRALGFLKPEAGPTLKQS
jgi:hypothetical protein